MEFFKQAHATYYCRYHLIFVTKYRRRVLKPGIASYAKVVYFGADGIWSDGYFISTVGVDEQIIRRYIQYQGMEDGGQATLDL